MRLLIVEDSHRLRTSLRLGFRKLGYAVDAVDNGRCGIQYALNTHYDVIILDLMLPQVDGLTVIKLLREENNQTHVIILSAKDQVQDRVQGLHLGADDYMVKPFSFDELSARISALLRRNHQQKNPIIQLSGLVYNSSLKEACIEGQNINLTPIECALFELLVLGRGRVFSYQQLEDSLYNADSGGRSRNAIEAHISSIRRKVKKHGVTDLIKTRRGIGYFIE